MPAPLLKTKLYIPPARPGLVSRPHLIARLDEALRLGHKLTLVSAPAGFGKTTLLAEWVESRSKEYEAESRKKSVDQSTSTPYSILPTPYFLLHTSYSWLSLDEGDNDPVRFLSYLIAALQTVQAQVGQEAWAMLQSPPPPVPESVLTLLINDLAVPSGPPAAPRATWVLVLDDYHLITAEPVHDAVAFLLDHLPPSMHIVLLTRADPPLPLARMRARDQLTEIRANDLRFTTQEATVFLNQVMDLGLAAGDITAMETRTEGWVAGLQLAALALHARRSPEALPADHVDETHHFVSTFTGSHHYIVDYLSDEVLDRQPEEIRSFLLQTSVVDRLTASLCNALTGRGDGQMMLEALQQANLFVVPLDDERRWYRYHRLFADLLRSRLQQLQPEQVPILQRRASIWYEQHGDFDAAIRCALDARDFTRAVDLVEREAEGTLMRGQVFTLLHWMKELPDELVRQRPWLCILHAWALLLSGGTLERIESRLQDADGADGAILGARAALRALVLALQGQSSLAAGLARQALEQLSREDLLMRSFAGWVQGIVQLASGDAQAGVQALDQAFSTSQKTGNVMLAVIATYARADVYMQEGQLHRAAEAYRRALDLATDAMGKRLPIAGPALVGLGELAREWNDLDAAQRYTLEGIGLITQWVQAGDHEAYVALARIWMALGNAEGTREALQKAQEAAARYDITDLDDVAVALFQARVWIAEGNLDAARRWAEERDLYQYIATPFHEEIHDATERRIQKYELLVLARLLLAEGNYGDALTLLESLIPVAEQRRRPGLLIEDYVLQALAFRAQGHLDHALHALERALALAEPEGYTRILVDEGPPMAELLSKAAASGTRPEYTRRLLSAFRFGTQDERPAHKENAGIVPPPSLVEPLTERELDILKLLPSHLTSTEIAQELTISTNTVRSHIKNIYSKLGVHNRSDAVEQARELHLL